MCDQELQYKSKTMILTADGSSFGRCASLICNSTVANGLAAIWRISFITARRWLCTSHIVLSYKKDKAIYFLTDTRKNQF